MADNEDGEARVRRSDDLFFVLSMMILHILSAGGASHDHGASLAKVANFGKDEMSGGPETLDGFIRCFLCVLLLVVVFDQQRGRREERERGCDVGPSLWQYVSAYVASGMHRWSAWRVGQGGGGGEGGGWREWIGRMEMESGERRCRADAKFYLNSPQTSRDADWGQQGPPLTPRFLPRMKSNEQRAMRGLITLMLG